MIKLKKGAPIRVDDEMWEMKDGTLIAVGAMTEQHAKNALRMVIRAIKKAQTKTFLKQLHDDPFAGVPPSGCDEYGSIE